jgi:succinate dehydrogenase/fumarate reductase flavoprotein subunit
MMTDSGGGTVDDTTSTDVLVVGGGPAGTWAAVSAAERGVHVTLVDKGYCGTSGATASGGNNLWLIPPGPDRAAAIRQRQHAAGALTDAEWMHRVLDTCWRRIEDLAAWGYPFPVDDDARPLRSSRRGGERSAVAYPGASTQLPTRRHRTAVVGGGAGRGVERRR